MIETNTNVQAHNALLSIKIKYFLKIYIHKIIKK